MSVIWTFPGQGVHYPGMLHVLPDHPETRRTLDEAGTVLGDDPLALDTAEALCSTAAVQLCLLIAGVATARILMAHTVQPAMATGLSIGAYPAAVVAGALDFSDAVERVAVRGRLMESAFPEGYGMAAIQGLTRAQVEGILVRVHSEAMPVYLANLNAEQQMVIAGAVCALDAVGEIARHEGASGYERLAVSIPSHCPLLLSAAEKLYAGFAARVLHRPRITYLSSNAARVLSDPERIADDIAFNMARQVHWHDTVQLAWERGARLADEIGPGSVLTGLTHAVFAEGRAVSCDNTRLETVIALMLRD